MSCQAEDRRGGGTVLALLTRKWLSLVSLIYLTSHWDLELEGRLGLEKRIWGSSERRDTQEALSVNVSPRSAELEDKVVKEKLYLKEECRKTN